MWVDWLMVSNTSHIRVNHFISEEMFTSRLHSGEKTHTSPFKLSRKCRLPQPTATNPLPRKQLLCFWTVGQSNKSDPPASQTDAAQSLWVHRVNDRPSFIKIYRFHHGIQWVKHPNQANMYTTCLEWPNSDFFSSQMVLIGSATWTCQHEKSTWNWKYELKMCKCVLRLSRQIRYS